MPTIIADLGGITVYGWVGAAYLLASTVSVPLYGKIADLFGRKRILLFGIVLFLLGSTASGFATNIWILIAARALQGLGAGAMQPISLTVIGDIFTIEERGKIQGVFGAVWAIAGIAGPLLGGTIVHYWSWPWVFWINIPFGLASMWILARNYHEKIAPREETHLDWLGALVLMFGSLSLLLGASREIPLLTIPLGIALFAAFVVIETRAKDPVLPLSMLRGKTILVATISSSLLGATMMGTLMYIPLFGQGVLGLAPADAGAAIAPMLVGWPVASAITSRMLTRIGFRAPVILGSVIIAVSLVIFAYIAGHGPSLRSIQVVMTIYGLGMGFANTALLIAVQSAVEWGQRGVATATTMFSRSMGGALGAGGLGAVLAVSLATTMRPEDVTHLLDPHRGADHAAASPEIVAALSSALTGIFWIACILGVLNVVVVAFYPRREIEADSGVLPQGADIGEVGP
jgi:EmrB/QacA subfamily drug resistance transporter